MIDDVYIGYVNIINYLILSSEHSMWVKYNTQQPNQYSWEDISHFGLLGDRSMQANIFNKCFIIVFQCTQQRLETA